MSDQQAGSSSSIIHDSPLERSKASFETWGGIPVARLHELVRPTLLSDKKPIRNWGGSFVCQPSRRFAPTSVEQCCAIVELARRIGGIEVRAIGRSHSPGDIVFTKDWIVHMDQLKGLLSISTNANGPTLAVLAGTFVSDIHAILEAATPPLCMSNVGSISEQTIGGLISTATHGTGIKQPVISAAVQSLRIVCALLSEDGGTKVVTCSRTENVELFNATLCGLGATGLIVEVTIQVDQLFKLKQISEECPFDFVFGARTGAPCIEVSQVSDNLDAPGPEETYGRRNTGWLLAHGHRLPPATRRYAPTARNSDPSHIHPVSLATAATRDTSEEEDDEVTRSAQKNLEFIINSSEFVRILWFATVGVCTVMRANRTLEPFQTPGVLARWKQSIINHRLTEVLLYLGRFNNRLPPHINRGVHYLTAPKAPASKNSEKQQAANTEGAIQGIEDGSIAKVEVSGSSPSPSSASAEDHLSNLQAFSSGGTFDPLDLKSGAVSSDPDPFDSSHARTVLVDTSHRVFNVDCLFPQYTDEWAIPLEHAASAIRAMRDWLEEEESLTNGERIHFPVEIRFADGDGIWMSHCQGRKTCFIGLTKYRPFDRPVRYRKLFGKFEILMRHYAGRPHWAKAHSCGPIELQSLYPHMQDYLHLLRKVDPNGVFRNPYIRRHLFGQITDDASSRIFKSRL
ncbi:hypothetical protein CBS101457_000390 [Exobasidium rhododendri]|nr:hypothetical protein CBS101457_000390 [Exobasidium rhododendri]